MGNLTSGLWCCCFLHLTSCWACEGVAKGPWVCTEEDIESFSTYSKIVILFYHNVFISSGSENNQRGHLNCLRPAACSLKRDSDWADPGGGLLSSQTRPNQWGMQWNADSKPHREGVWMQSHRQRWDVNVDENSHGEKAARTHISMRGE